MTHDEPGGLPSIEGVRALERYARGRRSVVYRAIEGASGRPLAVKVYAAGDLPRSFDARMAGRLASLRHPHLGRLLWVDARAAEVVMAWDWLPGWTLEGAPARASHARGSAIARQVLEALAVLHEAGIVHGNLHPGNVFVGPAGQVVLTDHGLGPPPLGYMAPEVAAGGPPTVASDLWSVGAVLARVAAGPGLPGESPLADPVDVLARVEASGAAPPRLREAARACLVRDPVHRPASARAVAVLLEAAGPASPDHGAVPAAGRIEPAAGASPWASGALRPTALAEVLAAAPPRITSAGPLRTLAVLLAVVALGGALLALRRWTVRPPPGLPPVEPRVTVGARKAAIVFPPDVASPPQVVYRKKGSHDPFCRVSGYVWPEYTFIDMADLEEGIAYEWFREAPSGERGPTRTLVTPVMAPRIEGLAFRPDGLWVAWSQPVRVPASLRVERYDEREARRVEVAADEPTWRLLPPVPPAALKELRVVVRDPVGDELDAAATTFVRERVERWKRDLPAGLDGHLVLHFLDAPSYAIGEQTAYLGAAWRWPDRPIGATLPEGFRPRPLGADPRAVGSAPIPGSMGGVVEAGGRRIGRAWAHRERRGLRMGMSALGPAPWPWVVRFDGPVELEAPWVWGGARVGATGPTSGVGLILFAQGPIAVPCPRPGPAWEVRIPPVRPGSPTAPLVLSPLDPAHPPTSVELALDLVACLPGPDAALPTSSAPCREPTTAAGDRPR